MSNLNVLIPYCADCMRKTKKDSLDIGEYYCDVVANILPKGIVSPDTDGTHCIELGFYIPVQSKKQQ